MDAFVICGAPRWHRCGRPTAGAIQVLDLLRKLAAHISVGDLGLGVQPLKHLGGGGDIPIFLNGVGPATNGSWDTRRGAIGGIDQGIAGDTGGLFGRLCKISPSTTSSFSPRLHGASPFLDLTGTWPLMIWQ